MKRKVIATLLTAAMVTGIFTGCSSSSSSQASTTAAPETTLAPAGSTEAASSKSEGDEPSCKGALEGVKLYVGTSGTYAPFSYFASDGTTLQGFDVDFLNALQEVLGFEIADGKIQDMDYGALVPSITEGKLDIGAAALCATDERKKNMNFSNTYYDAGLKVIVAKDNETIKSVDDLMSGDYKVAIHAGTLANEYVTSVGMPESCIQLYDSIALAYKAVEGGQADATIYDVPGTAYSISTGEINLKMVGDEFFNGQAPYALAISFNASKEHPEIIDYFNEAIAYLQENGTMDKIKSTWCE